MSEYKIDLVAEEKIMLSGDNIILEPKHTFSPGLYIRELFIPKGAIVIGKRHRHNTMNMLVQGKVTLYDEHGEYEVTAPFMAESAEFTKKAVIAHEDSIWVNIHPTNETDLDKIEAEFIIPEQEYLVHKKDN